MTTHSIQKTIPAIGSLFECRDLSTMVSGEGMEHDADFTVDVDGQRWHAYTAHISHCEVMLYCIEGVASYVVDRHHVGSFQERNTIELFDWQREE